MNPIPKLLYIRFLKTKDQHVLDVYGYFNFLQHHASTANLSKYKNASSFIKEYLNEPNS